MNTSRPTYHVVSHTHWDREWYLSFEEFRAMLVEMIDDLLHLLKTNPAYSSFTLDGQTIILEDYLVIKPERAKDIRSCVKQGKLFIGPWYVLSDEFLASGESLIRNLLTGTRVAKTFGGAMPVGYLPDTFGHIAMMPAILQGFDIGNAILYRGFGGEAGQKTSEYWWTSPDGSKVLMIHLPRNGYSGAYFHEMNEEQTIERFSSIKKEVDERATTPHRLVLNGGDHHWPDHYLPRTLDLLRSKFDGTIIHSSLPKFIEEVKKEMSAKASEVFGELRFGYRYAFNVLGGVYSNRVYLKQENWKCQTLFERYVEPLNVIGISKGMESQSSIIQYAYKLLLQNQAHDSICGCSVDSVHREMMTRFKKVEDIGMSVIDQCMKHIIPCDERVAHDDKYLFIFNPSPFTRTEVPSAQVKFYLQDVVVGLNPDVKVAKKLPPVSGFILRDEFGNEIPYQILNRAEDYDIAYSRHDYPKQSRVDAFTVLVDARNIPSVGYKGFRIEKKDGFPKYRSRVKIGKYFMENDIIRAEVRKNGEVLIFDKITRQRYPGLNLFEDSGDVGDTYNYSYPVKDKLVYSRNTKVKLSIAEKGPLRASIRISLTMHVPESATADRRSRSKKIVSLKITSTVLLDCYSRAVVFETTVENNAKDHRLRVLFPAGIKTDIVYADSQFWIAERKQKRYDASQFTIEHPALVAPMQRFITVKQGSCALTLFSYGVPEYELKLDGKGMLALTLLRCVGILAGDDLITRPGGKSGWHHLTPDAQCQGTQKFCYAVFPHAPQEYDTMNLINEQAEKFHYPFLTVRRKNEGNMKMEDSLLSFSSRTVVMSALKESEDQKAFIVRWWNPLHRSVVNRVTFNLPMHGVSLAKLNEIPIAHLSTDKTFSISSPKCAVTTLRLRKHEK